MVLIELALTLEVKFVLFYLIIYGRLIKRLENHNLNGTYKPSKVKEKTKKEKKKRIC